MNMNDAIRELLEEAEAIARRERMHASWGMILTALTARADGKIEIPRAEIETLAAARVHLHGGHDEATDMVQLTLLTDEECDRKHGETPHEELHV